MEESIDGVEGRAKSSIYRGSRDIIESAAIEQTRRGDLTGASRGVFLAGLSACALGADSASEALPFLRLLARETGEPGWVLARAGLAADSPAYMESLIALGGVDPEKDKVWNGYENESGARVRDGNCLEQAVDLGSHRCLESLLKQASPKESQARAVIQQGAALEELVERAVGAGDPNLAGMLRQASPKGLLARAVKSRHGKIFEALLARAVEERDQDSIDKALAELARRPNQKWDSNLLGAAGMAKALAGAGAKLGYDAGGPEPWASWNGSSPGKIEAAWVPALRLGEPGEELPEGASSAGSMEGKAFFSHWSSACLLARSAIDGGADEQGAKALSELKGWESSKAPGGHLSPLALMALADPKTTDSRLRRTELPVADWILGSPYLEEALRDAGPLSLARCALGRWLWGGWASFGAKSPWRQGGASSNALIAGLAAACERFRVRPLGVFGGVAAAQEFIGSMGIFETSMGGAAFEAVASSAMLEKRDAEIKDRERAAAKHLASFMQEESAKAFLDAVERLQGGARLEDPSERESAKEKAMLSLLPKAPKSGRSAAL